VTGASFLLIALVVAVVGTLLVMARNRPGHRANDAMAEFRREMDALAPPGPLGPEAPPSRRPFPGIEPLGRAGSAADDPDDDRPHPGGSRPDAGSGAR
jgi:hypothetical protein